ncbi:MAG TPA: hypothetical protein VFO15_18005 [Xanthobacteraceae bacterium]|nr:hypothetical protein [Xanthobacteraceae bacterium]
MLASDFDWVGLAAVISAVFAGLATLIGAWNHAKVRDIQDKVSTNGDPRDVGQIVTDVANTLGATAERSPVPGETVPPATP